MNIFKIGVHKLLTGVTGLCRHRGKASSKPLEGGLWSAPRCGLFNPGKTLCALYWRPEVFQGCSGRSWKISPTPGFDPGPSSPWQDAIPTELLRRVDSHKVGRYRETSTVWKRNLIIFQWKTFSKMRVTVIKWTLQDRAQSMLLNFWRLMSTIVDVPHG